MLGYAKSTYKISDDLVVVAKTLNEFEVEWIDENYDPNSIKWWNAYFGRSVLSVNGEFLTEDSERKKSTEELFEALPPEVMYDLFAKILEFHKKASDLMSKEVSPFAYTDASRLMWKGQKEYINSPSDMYPRFGYHPAQSFWMALNNILDHKEMSIAVSTVGALIISAVSGKAGKKLLDHLETVMEKEKHKVIGEFLGSTYMSMSSIEEMRKNRMSGILDFHDRAMALYEANVMKNLYIEKYVKRTR